MQLLLVKRAIGGISSLGSHLIQRVRGKTDSRPRRQQQQQQQLVQQQVASSVGKDVALSTQQPHGKDSSSSSSSGEGKTSSSSTSST